MAVRSRTFTYAVSLDRDWTATSDEGGSPLPAEDAWTPEHLLLTGLARCTLTSLRYHAKLRGLEVTASAESNGTVTKREADERYAFVEIAVNVDVALEPAPEDVRELIARAERDCFVGASLTVKPDYSWTVNGEAVS
ncbi:MAG: OsmC family protein [Actinobacteria bacterium]|nr:OsmC family protein [Actinomycetota bacterium]